MYNATESETLFQQFLIVHGLPFTRVPVASTPRPDFSVGAYTGWGPLLFEIKEITADCNFATDRFSVSTRVIGDHIRSKIRESNKQIKYGADLGIPSILIIYNALDTNFHAFGSEDHDFQTAMLGEVTLEIGIVSGALVNVKNGRNRSLREKHNTSFSAVGHLAPVKQRVDCQAIPERARQSAAARKHAGLLPDRCLRWELVSTLSLKSAV